MAARLRKLATKRVARTDAVDPARKMISPKPPWRRLGTNVYPLKQKLFEQDLGRVVRDYVIAGHTPSERLLEATDTMISLGGCLTSRLRRYLPPTGFASAKHSLPRHLNNSFAILDFVSWCVTGEEAGLGYRYDRMPSREIREWQPVEEQSVYAARFREAGLFFLSLGFAEVWQDRTTGGVFWRGLPEEIFNPDRHIARMTTVEENIANIERTIALIRQVNPEAPVVFALSPAPCTLTSRETSCITADCVSKSVLRVALDQVMSRRHPGVYYWPSFEIVRWVGAHLPWPAYGFDDDRTHNVTRRLVVEIAEALVESFYSPDAVELLQTPRDARTRRQPWWKRAKAAPGRRRGPAVQL